MSEGHSSEPILIVLPPVTTVGLVPGLWRPLAPLLLRLLLLGWWRHLVRL